MMMRSLLVTLLVIIGYVAVASSDQVVKKQDLLVGHREPGDFLVKTQRVERHSIPLIRVEEEVYIEMDNRTRITSVEILDVKGNGVNAKPDIQGGGPKDNFVLIHFISERGHGIHFVVKVYGIPVRP